MLAASEGFTPKSSARRPLRQSWSDAHGIAEALVPNILSTSNSTAALFRAPRGLTWLGGLHRSFDRIGQELFELLQGDWAPLVFVLGFLAPQDGPRPGPSTCLRKGMGEKAKRDHISNTVLIQLDAQTDPSYDL